MVSGQGGHRTRQLNVHWGVVKTGENHVDQTHESSETNVEKGSLRIVHVTDGIPERTESKDWTT